MIDLIDLIWLRFIWLRFIWLIWFDWIDWLIFFSNRKTKTNQEQRRISWVPQNRSTLKNDVTFLTLVYPRRLKAWISAESTNQHCRYLQEKKDIKKVTSLRNSRNVIQSLQTTNPFPINSAAAILKFGDSESLVKTFRISLTTLTVILRHTWCEREVALSPQHKKLILCQLTPYPLPRGIGTQEFPMPTTHLDEIFPLLFKWFFKKKNVEIQIETHKNKHRKYHVGVHWAAQLRV